MARGRTNPAMASRIGALGARRMPVKLLVEEAMEVRLEDELVAEVRRTPGHDYELAVGLLFTGGRIGLGAVREVRYCATGSAVETGFNVVSVAGGGGGPAPTTPGSRTARTDGQLAAAAGAAAASMTSRQELRARAGTGAAAAAFDLGSGGATLVREDASLLLALDKVVGRLHLDGLLPAADAGLLVSGDATGAILDKATAAGFGVVAAAGVPTSLAVAGAAEVGIVLLGNVGSAEPLRYA